MKRTRPNANWALFHAATIVGLLILTVDLCQLSGQHRALDTASVTLSLVGCLCSGIALLLFALTKLIGLLFRNGVKDPLGRILTLSSIILPSTLLTFGALSLLNITPTINSVLGVFLLACLVSLGMASLLGIRPNDFRWGYLRAKYVPLLALVHLGCYFGIAWKLKSIVPSYPNIETVLHICLLGLFILAVAQLIEHYAKPLDLVGLRLLGALQLGCILGLLTAPGSFDSTVVRVEHFSSTARQSLALLRVLTDEDKDGFSKLFAGGDCDDQNPKVNPHAMEIPGNKVDDNCVGGDAPLTVKAQTEFMAPNELAPEDDIQVRASVIWIVVDSLRSDRLGFGGHVRNPMPNVTKWGRRSARFIRTFAQAPHTPRSMPSMLTGKYPSNIEWVNAFENYPTPHHTESFLAEEFSANGYHTLAITSHWYFARIPEVLRGFDRTQTLVPSYRESADAEKTTNAALSSLARLKSTAEPFFLFVHYIDPHEPYTIKKGKAAFGERRLEDRYDSEVHYLDSQLTRLLEQIDELQTQEEVYVILTSDHGEAFREHGLLYHGRTLYNEEIRVPLLLSGPGVESQELDLPVGLVDLAPTIRELTGLAPQPSDGQSLLPILLNPEKQRTQPLYSELLPYPRFNQHRLAVISPDGRWKLIRNLTRHTIELFDLEHDPREKSNQFTEARDVGKVLIRALERYVDGRSHEEANSRTVDASSQRDPVRIRQTDGPREHRSNL